MSDRELSSNEIRKAFEASAEDSRAKRAERREAQATRRQKLVRRTKQTLGTAGAIGVLGLAGAADRESASQPERDAEAASERVAQSEGELTEDVEVRWPSPDGPENR